MRPRAWPEGPRKAGIGQRRGCFDRANILLERRHSATGSHLPSEDTAPPFAVAPFASSPLAHLIPQTHRRASGDLFSTSLGKRKQSDGIFGRIHVSRRQRPTSAKHSKTMPWPLMDAACRGLP